ncbi:hypothetical protein, partial [Microbacterium sp. 69-10]|uniref:hypothetical protein n=1 Tax=Microbacterium sp. 69-10 TaxID=1895783 RepID=UPI0025FF80CE
MMSTAFSDDSETTHELRQLSERSAGADLAEQSRSLRDSVRIEHRTHPRCHAPDGPRGGVKARQNRRPGNPGKRRNNH